MGGDHGPRVTLEACRRFLEREPQATLLLVGLPERLAGLQHPRARVVAASEVVEMDDPVEVALRKKRDSSMRIAVQQYINAASVRGGTPEDTAAALQCSTGTSTCA